MVKLHEVDGGIISDGEVLFAATSDSELLVPSAKKHTEQFGRPPTHLAGDRGFSSAENEGHAKPLLVKYVGLPAKGKLSLESSVPCWHRSENQLPKAVLWPQALTL